MRNPLVTGLAGLLAIALSTHARESLQFESPAAPGAPLDLYIEAGFEFRAPKAEGAGFGGGLIYRDSLAIFPHPELVFLNPGERHAVPRVVARIASRSAKRDGGLFTLHGWISEVFLHLSVSHEVIVTGLFAGGGRITNMLTLDGHVDALPDPPDFQTFELGPEWSDLVEVRFVTFHPDYGRTLIIGNSFDNIVVSIPEPSLVRLWVLALIVTVSWRIRRTKPGRTRAAPP